MQMMLLLKIPIEVVATVLPRGAARDQRPGATLYPAGFAPDCFAGDQ